MSSKRAGFVIVGLFLSLTASYAGWLNPNQPGFIIQTFTSYEAITGNNTGLIVTNGNSYQFAGDNTGYVYVGGVGSQFRGNNDGNVRVDGPGAAVLGSIASLATLTNSGAGSLVLADLTAGQSAKVTTVGSASILLGAGTVSNTQCIVVGDGNVSHGARSVTAGSFWGMLGGFFGNGAGLTNLPVDVVLSGRVTVVEAAVTGEVARASAVEAGLLDGLNWETGLLHGMITSETARATAAEHWVFDALVLSTEGLHESITSEVARATAAEDGKQQLIYNAESDFGFNSGMGAITNYVGTENIIRVPPSIGGVVVHYILSGGFAGASSASEIYIPDSVHFIDNNAFYPPPSFHGFEIYLSGPPISLGSPTPFTNSGFSTIHVLAGMGYGPTFGGLPTTIWGPATVDGIVQGGATNLPVKGKVTLPTPVTNNQTGVTLSGNFSGGGTNLAGVTDAGALPKTGGTMTGPIFYGTNKLYLGASTNASWIMGLGATNIMFGAGTNTAIFGSPW